MDIGAELNYLETTVKLFKYYKDLGERALNQLTGQSDYYWRSTDEANSIYIIINHLHGNMMSRFTDFLTTDGEKPWRNRDKEFESSKVSIQEIRQKWDQGWACVFEALDTVKEVKLDHIVYIRNEGHTILEALQRQLAHYAYHVGQIIYLAKEIKKSEWKSLSIPKGKSNSFNTEKFTHLKSNKFYTD